MDTTTRKKKDVLKLFLCLCVCILILCTVYQLNVIGSNSTLELRGVHMDGTQEVRMRRPIKAAKKTKSKARLEPQFVQKNTTSSVAKVSDTSREGNSAVAPLAETTDSVEPVLGRNVVLNFRPIIIQPVLAQSRQINFPFSLIHEGLDILPDQLHIKDALKALDSSMKSMQYLTKTGKMNLVEFYYSKSWMLSGVKQHLPEVLSLSEKENSACHEAVINEKAGLHITEQELEFVISFIEKNKISTVLEYGGTGMTTVKIMQKVDSIVSIEDDTPTCFRIASCIWSTGFHHKVEFFYHCSVKKYKNSPSEFSQNRDFINAVENVHSVKDMKDVDLVFVTGSARLGCALKALKFMGPKSKLILLTYPEPDVPDEYHANKLILGYFQKVKQVGRLQLMDPKPGFPGKTFTDKEIHFLHYITYQKYKDGEFKLLHHKEVKKKPLRNWDT